MLAAVEPFLNALPDDVIAVQISSRSAHLFSLERPAMTEATVTDLAARLRSLEAALMEIEAGIQRNRDDTDS